VLSPQIGDFAALGYEHLGMQAVDDTLPPRQSDANRAIAEQLIVAAQAVRFDAYLGAGDQVKAAP
jgi:hypothetical protein